jgi:tetratricopeptide (TPR) repeat protein
MQAAPEVHMRSLSMSRSVIARLALFAALLAAPALLAPPVLAAGGSDPAPAAKPADPNFTEGKKAIDAKDWARAIPLFQQVVAKDAQNADAWNWLGYAWRNQGDYPQSFAAYEKALSIDPRHRGAHEYIGEAYLKTGNLAKAEEHLKRLDSLCTFGCPEYRELKARIADFKAAKPS